MIVSLRRVLRTVIDVGDFLEAHLVVVAHVEHRLLLGWQGMDGSLQSHSLLIAELEVAIGSHPPHFVQLGTFRMLGAQAAQHHVGGNAI